MNDKPRIDGQILAKDIQIGRGAVVEPGVIISGQGGAPAERVILGDWCYIGRETRVYAPEFRLGHYSKWNAFGYSNGEQPLQIGRNCWIGGNVVLDSLGGLDIDDGVGIGAQSQVWTHIQFGDVVEGCRWQSKQYMHIGKDAWFVGSCLVSPVKVAPRAMALLGSVITHDMEANHVYGGVPAYDLTAKVGPQFEERTVQQKVEKLWSLIEDFKPEHILHIGALGIARSQSEFEHCVAAFPGTTWFDVSRRVYSRRNAEAEVAFLKRYTPLIKFTAEGEAPFIDVRVQPSLQMEPA